jgi:hypothetical protein
MNLSIIIKCVIFASANIAFVAWSQEKNPNNLPLCSDKSVCWHNCWGSQKNGSSNEVIHGEFKDGVLHGYGYVTEQSTIRFSGFFANGIWDYGTTTYNNAVYTGTSLRSQPHGTGTMKFSNGNTYSGGFKQGKFHGLGAYKAIIGESGSGIFKEGDLVEDKEVDLNSIQQEQSQSKLKLTEFIKKSKRFRTFSCPDAESKELLELFNQLADVTVKWRNAFISLRAATAAGSSASDIVSKDHYQWLSKRTELTNKFVTLWETKSTAFKAQYLEPNEKYTEINPRKNPFINDTSIWMYFGKQGEIVEIAAPPIDAGPGKVFLYPR